MKKRVLAIALIAGISFFWTACGNAEHSGEESHDTEMHEHEDGEMHDHEAMMEEAEEESNELLPVPEGANVFFANLEDGQTVTSPLEIKFGVNGMEVEPAGELHEGKGHHHIIIDGAALDRGIAVPADSVNIHYGQGQTETSLELSPGEHTLTMQFADGYHQSYGPQMSATIKVIVE